MAWTAISRARGDDVVNILEFFLLTALALLVVSLSGWLGRLLGVPPWVLTLPALVVGLRYVFGGGWATVVAALAVGAALSLSGAVPWTLAVLSAGVAFCLLRWLDARAPNSGGHPRPGSEDDVTTLR
jgi:hypothetical protein